jgi:hypothetical protein
MNATRTALKPLNPRSPDTKYTGLEPTWRVQPTDDRNSQLSRTFSWYNYFYGKKDAREMLVAYLEHNGRKADVRAKKVCRIHAMRLTTAWLCRMSMVGLELTDTEDSRTARLHQRNTKTREARSGTTRSSSSAKPNIQDRLREKVSECAGELDGMFDEFVTMAPR